MRMSWYSRTEKCGMLLTPSTYTIGCFHIFHVSEHIKQMAAYAKEPLLPIGDGEYHFWTSGTILPNDHWVWLSTGKPIIYANWSSNEPSGDNQKCLEIVYSLTKGLLWNNHECTNSKNVICETSLPKADSTQLAKLISSYNLTLIHVPAM